MPTRRRPGQIVAERYGLRDRLGVGGCGEVWRAQDRRLGAEVAVKFVGTADRTLERVARTFERERAALARIDAPGVAKVTDAGSDRGGRFLVLELVPGRNLAEVLADLRATRSVDTIPTAADLRRALGRPCPPGAVDRVTDSSWYRLAAGVVVEILRALEAVHAAGVLHRDVKPSNIVLRACGLPALIDFGMASLRGAQPGAITPRLFGTLPHLAPEQLASSRTGADARTDIYQVGLVMHELLTLRGTSAPRLDASPNAGCRALRAGRFAGHLQSVPPPLRAICLLALEEDPVRRYASAADFRRDLECWRDQGRAPRAGPSRAGDRRPLGRYLRRLSSALMALRLSARSRIASMRRVRVPACSRRVP